MGDEWKEGLSEFVYGAQMQGIYNYVQNAYATQTVYPPKELIFNAFKLTPINNIKVVIVGQDPYINPKQAMGLSFSVPRGTAVPPSLRNIYKCMEQDPDLTFQKPSPVHGDLSAWAKQGVFLINAGLTVKAGQPNSHKDAKWELFTDSAIKYMSLNCTGIVFMLWGAFAQKKARFINESKHKVLKSVHPSPMSARNGFFECQHFSKANKFLVKFGKEEIDWSL